MARLIDADDTKRYAIYLEGILTVPAFCIEHAPTVDAVEVVRCKDCKHWDKDFNWCDEKRIHMEADDFCSYGERRTDD